MAKEKFVLAYSGGIDTSVLLTWLRENYDCEVIAVCCNEALADKTLSNIVEVKARGAKVLALAFRGNKKIVSQADDVIFIPRIETVFTAALAVVPLQLLAYYAAKEKGCDIDKPKNLAKSVTVE